MCEQTLIHTCSQEYPGSARCVQSFDDSLDSAIRITYRISLRSSSMREPRHPSLKVVWHSVSPRRRVVLRSCEQTTTHARGSDCSQSRNGGRLKRFKLVCIEVALVLGPTKGTSSGSRPAPCVMHAKDSRVEWGKMGCRLGPSGNMTQKSQTSRMSPPRAVR